MLICHCIMLLYNYNSLLHLEDLLRSWQSFLDFFFLFAMSLHHVISKIHCCIQREFVKGNSVINMG